MKDTAVDQQTSICILWCIIHKDGRFLWKQFKCKFVSAEVFSLSTWICTLKYFMKLKKTEKKSAVYGGKVMVYYVQVLKYILLQAS